MFIFWMVLLRSFIKNHTLFWLSFVFICFSLDFISINICSSESLTTKSFFIFFTVKVTLFCAIGHNFHIYNLEKKTEINSWDIYLVYEMITVHLESVSIVSLQVSCFIRDQSVAIAGTIQIARGFQPVKALHCRRIRWWRQHKIIIIIMDERWPSDTKSQSRKKANNTHHSVTVRPPVAGHRSVSESMSFIPVFAPAEAHYEQRRQLCVCAKCPLMFDAAQSESMASKKGSLFGWKSR